jgi:integrase
VKGAKRRRVRLGNWLTAEEARSLWQLPNVLTLKGKRDRAILAILLGCGVRRRELADLEIDQFQRREDHWVLVDLIGNGGHLRSSSYSVTFRYKLLSGIMRSGMLCRVAPVSS